MEVGSRIQATSLRRCSFEVDLAKGLFAYLNSTVVDTYFRQFSGHTQVNATDLRKLTYPDKSTLRAIGADLPSFNATQKVIDDLVESHIHGRQ